MRSRWSTASSGVVGIVVLLTAYASAGGAAQRSSAGWVRNPVWPDDNARVALDVLTAMYPCQLSAPRLQVTINTPEYPVTFAARTDASLHFQILRSGLEPRSERKVLEAGASWDAADDLAFISVDGTAAVRQRREAFGKAVDQHPEWSKDRVGDEMRWRNARFLPTLKHDFLAFILPRIRAWPPALGTLVDMEAEFDDGTEAHPTKLLWIVKVRMNKRGITEYTLTVDPFEGEFLGLRRSAGRAGKPVVRPDNGRVALDVLTAMYPALVRSDSQFTITAVDLGLLLDAVGTQIVQLLRPGSEAPGERHVVTVEAYFNRPGEPSQVRAGGTVSARERREALLAVLKAHPEWSDARDGEELTARGARFGPGQKEALLASVLPRIRALSPVLGPVADVQAEFVFRYGNDRGPICLWTVHVKLGTRGSVEYDLDFDPFEADFHALYRQTPPFAR